LTSKNRGGSIPMCASLRIGSDVPVIRRNRPGDPVVGILQGEGKRVAMRALIVLCLSITRTVTALAAEPAAQKVDDLFAAFSKPGSPGCSVGVIRNGSFIYKKSFGYASLELGVP